MTIPIRRNGPPKNRTYKPPAPKTESAEGRKARKKLYNSAAWQRCRAVALRAQPFCPECLKTGVYEPATEVHHIKDLADGGAPFSLENLQPLCRTHHSQITSRRMDRS